MKEIVKLLEEFNGMFYENDNTRSFPIDLVEIENQLKYAEIITVSAKKDVAGVGSTVTFTDLTDGKSYTFSIVGTTESDFKAGKISNESPIGKALIGKRVGEETVVAAPNGGYSVKLEKVEY